jgi:DNA-directed RNA polymerase subunit RPC12/RpoP
MQFYVYQCDRCKRETRETRLKLPDGWVKIKIAEQRSYNVDDDEDTTEAIWCTACWAEFKRVPAKPAPVPPLAGMAADDIPF